MNKSFNWITVLLLLAACQSKKNNDGTYNVVQNSDSLQYVQIADAKTWDASWKKENTLVYQVLQEPDNLHPTNGKTLMRSEVMLYTQYFLINIDYYSNKLRPSLVKSLPVYSQKDMSYTYELRDEPTWDNGDRLSVDDIIFSLKAYKCPFTQNDFFKPYLENMSDIVVDAANPRMFTIKVKKPYIQDVAIWGDIIIMQRKFHDPQNVLANYTIAQLSTKDFDKIAKSDVKEWSKEFNAEDVGFDPKKLNGLGAYKVAEWQQGQYLTLVKKANHWTKNSNDAFETAYPEKIIFKINQDPNSNILEFKKQSFDASTTLATKSLFALQQDSLFNSNYNSQFTNTYNYSYAAFNTKPDGVKNKKLFNDVKVRKAMCMLVPYEQINKVVYMGQYKRQEGPVCHYKKEFNKDLKATEYNFNEAVKLLANAGWKDTDADGVLDKTIDGVKTPFEFSLNVYAGIPDWQDFALLMAGEMKKAGIVVNVTPLDVPTVLEKAHTHNFDMMLSVWTTSVAPEDYTQIWHSQSWTDNGDNYSGFGTPESDALIDSMKYEMDDAKRIAMDGRFQQMVVNEYPYIFMFNSQRRVAVHKRFGNCEMFFEKPGILLNNLKLLPEGATVKDAVNP